MDIQRNKLNHKPRARRRVRMRTALLLTLGAFLMTALSRVIVLLLPGMAAAARVALELLFAVSGFGGAAYAGLYVIDGRHAELIPRRVLSPAQGMWYALAGVLAIAPVSLCQDVMLGVLGAQASAGGVMDAAAFLPMLIKSALLVPVLEEVFFRGYLQGTLSRYGKWQAVAAVSLLFALMHGDLLILPHALFGALLGVVVMKTDSILAPMLVHGCYNLAVVLLSYMGLGGLFAGLSVISCVLRVGMTLAFVYALRRAMLARVVRLKFELPDLCDIRNAKLQLSRRETALLVGAAAAVLASTILAGVMA